MTPAPVEDSDSALVARAGLGEASACTTLVDRYLSRVQRLAWRTLRDATESEDVAQEVFLRVWAQAPRWSPGAAKFSTWIYRVTYNLCVDRLRQRRPLADQDLDELLEPTPSAAAAADRSETVTMVRVAVHALPPRQRAALSLCHYDGLTNIEAADVMGISVDAIESLLSRARRALRARLAPAYGGNESQAWD